MNCLHIDTLRKCIVLIKNPLFDRLARVVKLIILKWVLLVHNELLMTNFTTDFSFDYVSISEPIDLAVSKGDNTVGSEHVSNGCFVLLSKFYCNLLIASWDVLSSINDFENDVLVARIVGSVKIGFT